ncbi:putative glycosyl hydrolase [Actinoplanes missouriensis 431]|uniref:chitinase n=1 Tax=Actinoplanes missouriensis (strain ATCC 14538 / DSM 43046 / CBS 188.64 / JCM 3121 / NBRC 102363 / NCIMB 12654 / NRRL B-3342 / UNCC 431) TaxID=512565 RepID=I0GY38_ACTM4|nr:putative glycosyl hydrolase [Actinoplanes missouriensis 431]
MAGMAASFGPVRLVSALLVPVLMLAVAACGGEPRPSPSSTPAQVVAGYFTEWGVYGRGFRVKNVQESGAARRLTHLKYAFGKVDDGRCAVGDPWAAYRKPIEAADSVDGVADSAGAPLLGSFGQLRKLKAANPRLKVLWSFGGWSGSAGFTRAAADPAGFAASCRALINDPRWSGLFDGIDVDWEYPNACGVSCDASGPGALTAVLAALRASLGADALITAAVPGDVGKLRATDYAGAARYANWLGAMTYDYFGASTGPDDRRTAAHSALSAYPGIPRTAATTESTVAELLALGVPAAKVLIGVGFYGRGWTGVDGAEPGATATGPAPGRYGKGIEDYHVLVDRCPPTGTAGGQAYARCGAQWWSYDTPETITEKVTFARQRGLGGLFAWELSGDTPDARLLTALSRS